MSSFSENRAAKYSKTDFDELPKKQQIFYNILFIILLPFFILFSIFYLFVYFLVNYKKNKGITWELF